MSGDQAARRMAIGIVIGFGLLIILTNLDWCAWPAPNAVKDGNASTCWEFWLNRYQTLIGATLALLAGAAAFWATFSQFRLSRQDQLRRELALAIEHQRKVFRLQGKIMSILDTSTFCTMLIYPDQRALIAAVLKERDPIIEDIEKISQEVIFESYQPYSKVVYPRGLGSWISEMTFAKASLWGFDKRIQAAVAGWSDESRRPDLIRAVHDQHLKCIGFITSLDKIEDEASDGPRAYSGFDSFLHQIRPLVKPID